VVLSIKAHYSAKNLAWVLAVEKDIQQLATSRPTAVNLCWALKKMQEKLTQATDNPMIDLEILAKKIHQEDIEANYKMGELGAQLLLGAKGVMTHCNAGALATGGYGTALGVIRSAYQQGLRKIYAGETRPWRQGARLTVWELAQDNISSTLIADSAAAWLMKSGAIDWVIVGADRIASNGDVANKIGTYSLAVLAKQHGVKVMVVAPISTIDWAISSGDEIEIEQRAADELLTSCYRDKATFIDAWNPVFDVTPATLISAIITEKGRVLNPSENNGVKNLQ
jgi:methylthioribose-1-phosphate isomerase